VVSRTAGRVITAAARSVLALGAAWTLVAIAFGAFLYWLFLVVEVLIEARDRAAAARKPAGPCDRCNDRMAQEGSKHCRQCARLFSMPRVIRRPA
jgi:hypothetical protein